MTAVSEAHTPSVALARRNVAVLALAQALGGAPAPINMAVGALAGFALLGPDKSLATLPITAFVAGTACGTVPAALLQARLGRRLGLISGMGVGATGALIEAVAMLVGSFGLLCLGAFLVGFAAAFAAQLRFAAAETADEALRPRAISLVMAGGIASAIIGPQAVLLTSDLFAPIPFVGAFVAAGALSLSGAAALLLLAMPRRQSGPRGEGGRPLGTIARQPAFIVAVLCAMVSYAVMSLVMTAAPLAMVEEHHHAQRDAMLGIQWHVLAMFGPSFFTGSLIARFGAERVVAVGLVLLLAASATALAGITVPHSWAALILLGLGWNFGFIGGTALVAHADQPGERARIQGLNDFLVFGAVALASLTSGKLLAAGGWTLTNMVAIGLTGTALLVLLAAMAARASLPGTAAKGPSRRP